MDVVSLFHFYSLCVIIFFSLGIYLFEKKQPLYGYFCIIVAFFILAGLSILFESIALEILCLIINTALICNLLWTRWAQKFIGIFMLIVQITQIKRLIKNATSKTKK